MNTLTIKYSDIIDKIEENGLPHIRGRTFMSHRSPELGACAMGQAFWNLMGKPETIDKVKEQIFWDTVLETHPNAIDESILDKIVEYNDTEKLSLREMASRLRVDFADALDYEVTIKFEDENDSDD